MNTIPRGVQDVLRGLVDDYRHRCLWFLRLDYYPETIEDALSVLQSIERHGDLEAFRRAGEVRRWLSQPTNAKSAGS